MPASNSMTPRAAKPETATDLTSAKRSTAPDMPHERDQQVGSTDGAPSTKVQQGAEDVKRGVQDTSRALEANQAYEKQKK